MGTQRHNDGGKEEEVNGSGQDVGGNTNRKDRRKCGLVKDAYRLLAYGW